MFVYIHSHVSETKYSMGNEVRYKLPVCNHHDLSLWAQLMQVCLLFLPTQCSASLWSLYQVLKISSKVANNLNLMEERVRVLKLFGITVNIFLYLSSWFTGSLILGALYSSTSSHSGSFLYGGPHSALNLINQFQIAWILACPLLSYSFCNLKLKCGHWVQTAYKLKRSERAWFNYYILNLFLSSKSYPQNFTKHFNTLATAPRILLLNE